jgi:hypothetical protein
MTFFLIGLLILELVAMLTWGTLRSERTFQFPFLTAVAFAGYLLPQIIGLTQEPYLPDGALSKTVFMAALCLAAAYWGYVSNRNQARTFQNWTFSYRRLVKGSAALTAIGAFFYYKVSLLAAEVSLATGGQWTGVITIYVFFSQMLTIGFVLALVLHLKRPSWPTLAIVLFGLAFYLERVLIHGRRSAMIELFLIIVMALWFNRRWAPPRWSVIAGVMAGTLLVNSIGDYRSTMLEADSTTWSGAGLTEVLEIDYLGNLERNFTVGGFDVTNALYRIEAADRTLAFDYGFAVYNAFVTLYVPAQIVGAVLKSALKINIVKRDNSPLGHTPHTGTTVTGISEAFLSFWYFGAGMFFLIGRIANRWYKAAVNGGSIGNQTVAILIAYPALLAFPSSLSYFFFKFFELLIFLAPVLLWARTVKSPAPRLEREAIGRAGRIAR